MAASPELAPSAPPMPAVPRPVIREATFDDYERVAALQVRHGLATAPRREWQALWTENPVYRRLRGEWPIGWVLETVSADVVGFISSLPVAYRFRGREVLAAVTGSWVTDPAWRGYSMMVLNAVHKRGGADLYLTNTASAKTDATLRMLGWSRVPAGRWDQSWFWVARSYGFARWFLANRGFPLPGVLAVPVSPVVRLSNWWVARRLPAVARRGTVEICAGFDARFDTFWEEVQARNPGVLLGGRSRETLAWHFAGALERGALHIVTHGSAARINAYAIFDRRDAQGLTRLRLVDFQAIEDAPEALAAFLSRMLREMRHSGVHVLESAGYPLEVLGGAGRIAPYCRPLDAWKYYFKAASPELREALAAPEAWAPSYYDGDASL